MKIGVVGGAGAMGGAIGASLAEAGHQVHLFDVDEKSIELIREHGLTIQNQAGSSGTLSLPASSDPTEIGRCDLVLVFVKCYHTVAAVQIALPMIGEDTIVLSLQNGWGNGAKIAALIGESRLLVGVTYHSASRLEPGRVLHAGIGPTYVGRLDGSQDEASRRLAVSLDSAAFPCSAEGNVLDQIWKKLCLNACTLPTSSSLGLFNCQLVEREGTRELMKVLLREAVTVATAMGATIDEDERWQTITALLERVGMSKSSMFQDVSAKRQTEIEAINGAVVDTGRTLGIPTPYNQAMVWIVNAVQEGYL